MATVVGDADEAIAGIADGATVLIGGFGTAGQPIELIDALVRSGVRDLTVVNNNAGNGQVGLAALLRNGPGPQDHLLISTAVRLLRLRSALSSGQGGARVGASGQPGRAIASRRRRDRRVLLPTGVGTPLPDGKECRTIDGRHYILEYPIKGDVALIKAARADTLGNLVYRKTARNFGPVMATAAKITVVQVSEIVQPGGIDPEVVITPGIFVDRIVKIVGMSPLSATGPAG